MWITGNHEKISHKHNYACLLNKSGNELWWKFAMQVQLFVYLLMIIYKCTCAI